jgi:hypothetical protein
MSKSSDEHNYEIKFGLQNYAVIAPTENSGKIFKIIIQITS